MGADTEAEERLRRNPETMAMLEKAKDDLRQGLFSIVDVDITRC